MLVIILVYPNSGDNNIFQNRFILGFYVIEFGYLFKTIVLFLQK